MATLTIRAVSVLLVLSFAAIGLAYLASTATDPPSATAAIAKGDKDRADFPTQKKAQKFFKRHNPSADPHYLDADNDRIACEDNRCPCTRKWHQQHGRLIAIRTL